MSFEALAHQHEFTLTGFPAEWLPLTYLYDPDLPLFPLVYLHLLDPTLPNGQRPQHRDRIYGYVRQVALIQGGAKVTLVLNKNLADANEAKYIAPLETEVAHRLGCGDPITEAHIRGALKGSLSGSNDLLLELWHGVVGPAFGGKLPFGRILDPVFGLVRYIASWFSEGGRKGELIQTHYFLTAFGERIHAGSPVNVDFYLLPTFAELRDTSNTLALFPKFRSFIGAAKEFVDAYCEQKAVGSHTYSFFRAPKAGFTKLDTASLLKTFGKHTGASNHALHENYNAFDRGPMRSVLSLMMFHDIRTSNVRPDALSADDCREMYLNLGGSYQSPKVMQLYAQQCFAAEPGLPLDNWVTTFLKWPLNFKEDRLTKAGERKFFAELFAASDSWGRIERLIWVAAQARKVHSSVCASILWCVRFGGEEKKLRGANPLSCKICASYIRDHCPSYDSIRGLTVSINATGADFVVKTSTGAAASDFDSVSGQNVFDRYSPRDRPLDFKPYPQPGQPTGTITVEKFIELY